MEEEKLLEGNKWNRASFIAVFPAYSTCSITTSYFYWSHGFSIVFNYFEKTKQVTVIAPGAYGTICVLRKKFI